MLARTRKVTGTPLVRPSTTRLRGGGAASSVRDRGRRPSVRSSVRPVMAPPASAAGTVSSTVAWPSPANAVTPSTADRPATSTVWSANCSFSMLRTVSVPSGPETRTPPTIG